jgi:O-methyltransferase involved in polyketide biosynthesis
MLHRLTGHPLKGFPIHSSIGRVVGRILLATIGKSLEGSVNFVFTRSRLFEHLIKAAIPSGVATPHVVEIAAGFAARGIRMANALPNIQVTEVDLPSVMEQKQTRLQQAAIVIPPNIRWYGADLGVTPLRKVLNDQPADIIAAEGLLGYFSVTEIGEILHHVYQALKPGGIFIGDVTWGGGIEAAADTARTFSRQAGTFKTIVHTQAEGQKLLEDAGFVAAQSHLTSDYAAQFNVSGNIIVYSLVIQGQRPLDA